MSPFRLIGTALVTPVLLTLWAPPAAAAAAHLDAAGPEARAAFERLLAARWRVTFKETGDGDWRQRWDLDGLKGEVRAHGRGLLLQAGPIADDHASHVVLWTRPAFHGPVRIEFDYTRLDTVNRGVNILYLHATGTGEGPYAEDIRSWAGLRTVPFMSAYFDHMHLLHVSFAAYELDDTTAPDYVRARRYPRALANGSFDRMQLSPDYLGGGIFQPGELVRVVVVKDAHWLFLSAVGTGTSRLFAWSLNDIPPLAGGRIGIRHMFQRAALYENFRVSELILPSP